MEKNKNILIGGLLAIVLVMAVGYAAFATQLTINGTATITSNWDVHFDQTKTWDSTDNTAQVSGVVAATAGLTGATAPTGDVSYTDGQHATIAAHFNQPGDVVIFTLTIENGGSLDATTTGSTVTATGTTQLTQLSPGVYRTTNGNIKITVTDPTNNLTKSTGANPTRTMTVRAEFVDANGTCSVEPTTNTTETACKTAGGTWTQGNTTGNLTTQEEATMTIGLNYTQA